MIKDNFQIDIYYPNNSMGLDLSQIQWVLNDYFSPKNYYYKITKNAVYDCGSGRHITIRKPKRGKKIS